MSTQGDPIPYTRRIRANGYLCTYGMYLGSMPDIVVKTTLKCGVGLIGGPPNCLAQAGNHSVCTPALAPVVNGSPGGINQGRPLIMRKTVASKRGRHMVPYTTNSPGNWIPPGLLTPPWRTAGMDPAPEPGSAFVWDYPGKVPNTAHVRM